MRFAPVILAAFLAVDPWGFDRFGPLRFALVATCGFAAVWLSLSGTRASATPLPSWVRRGGGLLGAGILLSTLLSKDRWHGLVGTPDRHFGLVTFLLCGGLFVAAFRTARHDPDRTLSAVLRALTVGTLGAGLYSIAETAELADLDLDFANDRIGGPWGQPAFLGAAMLLGIPASALHAHQEVGFARILSVVAASVGTIALVTSQSRAAWVALTAVAMILLLARWRTIRDALGPVRAATGAGVVVVVLLLVAVLTPAGARAWSLTDVGDGVVGGRIDEWQVGFRALLDTDTFGVLGHGPEAYRTVFGAHVDQAYVMDHGRDTFTDRAHNSGLDIALSGGLIAAAGWITIVLGLGGLALRALRRGSWIEAALGSAVLAHLIHGLFLFPLAEVDPVFWVLAGLFLARSIAPAESMPTGPTMAAVAGLALVLAGAAAAAGTLDVLADHRIRSAASTESAVAALDHADAARSLRPDSIRYHFAAARIAASRPNGGGVQGALERLQDGLDWSPRDPALLHQQTLVLINEARRTVAPDAIAAALEPLAALDRTDPNHPEGQQRYGIALALDGQTSRAIEQFEHAAYMTPNEPEALLNLAFVHLSVDDTDAAVEAVRRAVAIAPDDDRVRRLVAELDIEVPQSS